MSDTERLLEKANQDAQREAERAARWFRKRQTTNDEGETDEAQVKKLRSTERTGLKRKAEEELIESGLQMHLAAEMDLERREVRNSVRKQVDTLAPVILTRIADIQGQATREFLGELARKHELKGRYYIWKEPKHNWDTNMPEFEDQQNVDKREAGMVISECVQHNLRNTKRTTNDRQGLSVSEEVSYIGNDWGIL